MSALTQAREIALGLSPDPEQRDLEIASILGILEEASESDARVILQDCASRIRAQVKRNRELDERTFSANKPEYYLAGRR